MRSLVITKYRPLRSHSHSCKQTIVHVAIVIPAGVLQQERSCGTLQRDHSCVGHAPDITMAVVGSFARNFANPVMFIFLRERPFGGT